MIVGVFQWVDDLRGGGQHVWSIRFQQDTVLGKLMENVHNGAFFGMETIPGEGEIGPQRDEASCDFNRTAERVHEEGGWRRFFFKCLEQRIPSLETMNGHRPFRFAGDPQLVGEYGELDFQ